MTNPILQFRPATAADIPAMSAIRLAVTENTLSKPSLITRQMYLDHLERLGRSWVCERAGVIIGFSCAARDDASIWALFVQPGCEGLGAGQALLKLAVDWLFSLGAAQLKLGTAPATRAERFYRAQGWACSELLVHGELRFTLQPPASCPPST